MVVVYLVKNIKIKKDFTICLGIACIFSQYYHQKNLQFKINVLLRDIYIFIYTLIFLIVILWDGKINLIESLILFSLHPLTFIYLLTNNNDEVDDKIL